MTLLLGGARSGKSRRAEALGRAFPGSVTYVATGPLDPGDPEWEARVAAHRARRPSEWRTLEVHLDLAGALETERAAGDRLVIVDCLTLWLSSWMLESRDPDAAVTDLERAIATGAGTLVLVSNEVGSGIVPATSLGRRFRDAQGRLNQRIAAAADRVELLVAGLRLVLKSDDVA